MVYINQKVRRGFIITIGENANKIITSRTKNKVKDTVNSENNQRIEELSNWPQRKVRVVGNSPTTMFVELCQEAIYGQKMNLT